MRYGITNINNYAAIDDAISVALNLHREKAGL